MAIEVRLLNETEIELANNFFNSIYNTQRTVANFRWEFLEGPDGKAIYIIAIDTDFPRTDKVVGIQCAIPIALTNTKGETVLTAKSEDTLVDPEYRGRKIFERMYDLLFEECKKAGIKYIWGFTPAKKAFERINFEIPYQAQQGLMVLNPIRAYSYLSSLNPTNKVKDKLKIAGLSILSFVVGLKRMLQASGSIDVISLPISSKTAVMSALTPGSSLYFLNMTHEYMEWRLKRNPFGNEYINYQFYKAGSLIADAIVNIRPPGVGYIEQIIFSDVAQADEKKAVTKKLLSAIIPRVHVIRFICFDINEALRDQKAVFSNAGFVILKRGAHFVWRRMDADIVKPNNLFLTRLFTQGNQ